MDELIYENCSYSPETAIVPLCNLHKIALFRLFEVDFKNKKKYMRNIVIIINNEFITQNMADTILLKEELVLFDKGDEQNRFLQIVSRKINNKNITSLLLKLRNNGAKVYISRTEARAIVTMFNMSLQGYSFSRILENETQQSLQSWTKILFENYLLENED